MSILNHDPRKRLALIGAAILVFVLGIGLGLRLSSSSFQAGAEDTAPPPLIHQGEKIIIPEGSPLRSHLLVEPATVKSSPHTLQLPAAVEADPARTVNVLPPVAGKVVQLKVYLGDHITKGQPLAVIDSADLAQAYADDDKGRDALQHAKSTLERVRGVYAAGGSALKDLEQARSDYAQAQAEFNRAEARLKEIGVSSQAANKSRLLTLTAPMTGTVTALTTSTGSYANDLTAPLMTISNLDSVWVTANVPEKDLAFVAKGQSVEVTFPAYPGKVFHSTVAFVSDVVDPDTRRTKVRMVFANPDGKLKPNMFANAIFNVPQKSAVFVPNSALVMENDSTVVLLEVEPWAFVRRAVLPGYGEGDGVRIEQGLNPGDRVVVKGAVLLND